jgi:hypothetical protein
MRGWLPRHRIAAMGYRIVIVGAGSGGVDHVNHEALIRAK